MNSIEILEGALALCSEGCHFQANREANRGNGGMGRCVFIGLFEVSENDISSFDQAVTAFAKAIGGTGQCDIFRWHDAPGRTFPDVEDAFQRAIRNEKARLGIEIEVPTKEPVPA